MIILDDLGTDEPLTPEQSERLKKWFEGAVVDHFQRKRDLPFGFVRPHL